MVLLAELHTLSPSVVALVQISRNAPEFNQLVLLQLLSQADIVEVVIGINRCSQALGRQLFCEGGGTVIWLVCTASCHLESQTRLLPTCLLVPISPSVQGSLLWE